MGIFLLAVVVGYLALVVPLVLSVVKSFTESKKIKRVALLLLLIWHGTYKHKPFEVSL